MTVAAMPASPPKASSPLYKSLFVQVLTALVLGVVLGVATPQLAKKLKVLNQAIKKLI
jgi:aerobic C4-dicarboxylate transport protein